MNTNSKKFYTNKTERSFTVYEQESNRISTFRRLIRLAYRESNALLSLYEQYEEIFTRAVLSTNDTAALSNAFRKCYDVERQLRATARRFFDYSREIPDPWVMVNNYHKMYKHFSDMVDHFGYPIN